MKPSPDDTGRTSTPAGAAEVLSSTKESPSIEVDASVARAFADDNWMVRTSRAIAQTDLGMLAGYRIERVVARGAQGVVYEAKEPRTGRRVAIKRLPSEDGGSIEATRFAREAETLAALAHPNVVALLAAPNDDGSRLIVMEWVDGVPFDVWADRIWSSLPSAEAMTRIVRTLADIASAVAAAHRRGVMHRDIKPSNVLVTASDEAKVLDFGLAKGFADTPLVTRTGGFAGTPGWASPEQVAARAEAIDARTDVHALGLLLYRALTGRTAFDTNLPILPLFEAIQTEVPPSPSRLRNAIPRELDLITMQALEKDAERRYQSADAFRRDLERFLAEEPIDAHPPSMPYVIRKFVRRHKAVTTLAVLAAAAVVSGTIVSAYLAIDASEARNAAVARADEADRARDRAERMNGFFRDLLANLREREVAGDRAGAKEIIALAAESIERAGVPRESEADLRRTLGLAFHEVGDYPRAALQYARAAELLTSPEDAVHLVAVLLAEARSLQHSARRPEAPDRAHDALAVIDRINAPAPLRAEATGVLAATLVFAGQPASALVAADEAIALARAVRDDTVLAHAMSTKALALDLSQRLPEATEYALEAAELARSIPNLRPTERARMLHNAAMMLTNTNRAAEALPLAEESLAIREAYFGKGHPAATPGRSQLAITMRELGRYDDAIALHLAIIASLADDTPESLLLRGNARRHLARTLEVRGAPGDAERLFVELREGLRELARSGPSLAAPTFSASKMLFRKVLAAESRDAALRLALDFGDEIAQIGGSPVQAAAFRSELPRELLRTGGSDPWIPDAAWITRFQADADAARAELDATSEARLRIEIALAEVLSMSASEADRGQARALAAELRQRSIGAFGDTSSLVSYCDAVLKR